jgi:hypothetical protein
MLLAPRREGKYGIATDVITRLACPARTVSALPRARVERATSLKPPLERLDVDELLDHLGRLAADDVPAEQLAVLPVADDLHQAGAIAVGGVTPPTAP